MIQHRNYPTSGEAPFKDLIVAQVMQPNVKFGHERTKADVLASLMIEGFGGVPIVDDQERLVGIVSEFDLLAALESGKKLSAVSALDLMTRDVASVALRADVQTVIHVLQTNHLIRAPVVDQEGKLVGIVARRDILRVYLSRTAD